MREHQPPSPARPGLGKHAAWTDGLPPVAVVNRYSGAREDLTLYGEDGLPRLEAIEAFAQVASRDGDVHLLHPRLVQLAFKAAYHFAATRLVIISAYRTNAKRRSGYHEAAAALDFALDGIDSRKLASYLRKLPKVGVGIYTHRLTRFVHLDVRDQSFHWLDGSPPGKTWRERPLADPKRDARDAAYVKEADLPVDDTP